VVDPSITDQTVVTDQTASVPKYGVYVGSAPFIGQEPTRVNQSIVGPTDQNGVDQLYTPPGLGDTVVALIPVFRSIRVDTPTAPSGG